VLDHRDRGPSLTAGNFSLRVTNAGILGNAFLDVGLSFDPSFEYPIGSGHEALNYAALWVGAIDPSGRLLVSGGPLLEFRPTLDPGDRVTLADFGRLGAQRFIDDDGDGRVDEETLNGRDDDGDGEVDEDLGMFSQQLAVADYVDDTPEAVRFGYAGGERHNPLGLSVHQEAYAWAVPGYDGIAGLKFVITNHGATTLRQVRVGLYADLDSRARDDPSGHYNDRITHVSYSRTVFEGISSTTVGGYFPRPSGGPLSCSTALSNTLPVLVDGASGSGLPAVAVVPLSHTTDPLALLEPAEARAAARAPGKVSFRATVFAYGQLPGRGGPPQADADRYAALAGSYPGADEQVDADYSLLVSCGPFASLGPGQSIEFEAALVAAVNPDSLRTALGNAAVMHHGLTRNVLPDSTGPDAREWRVGETGLNGHEVCIEPPPGVTFMTDPHCPTKYLGDYQPGGILVTYEHGRCVWTDADCNECTGLNGFETREHWLEPGLMPPQPAVRAVALDRGVRVEWDNTPEILLQAGVTLLPAQRRESRRSLGYHVWKLADWRDRRALVPDRARWALVGNFGPDSLHGQLALSTITDSSLAYMRLLYEQPQYPVGHYAFTDHEVLDGFDYLYTVTSLAEVQERDAGGTLRTRVIESPIDVDFAQRVVPRAEARPGAGDVWVVPNPFRARADWDLPRTLGNPLTRHLDFMGLPRDRCTIKIWTLAGDFVAQIDHDGRSGDGQASWNLVTRNGQEASSGIYLFSVDSPAGHEVGRFVVIR
jgi:hypothetical protein